MKKLNVDNIDFNSLKGAYKVIDRIMEDNTLNYNSAWVHVKSYLGCAIVDKML